MINLFFQIVFQVESERKLCYELCSLVYIKDTDILILHKSREKKYICV